MRLESDPAPSTIAPRPPRLSAAALERIETHLRRHFDQSLAAMYSRELQRGHIVHAPTDAPGVVAFRQGVLFVAGTEYVIADD